MDISKLWVKFQILNLDQLQNIKRNLQTLIREKKDKIFMSKLTVYQKQIVEEYKTEDHTIQWDAQHNNQSAISVFHNYHKFEHFMEGNDYSQITDDMFVAFHKSFIKWKNKQGKE